MISNFGDSIYSITVSWYLINYTNNPFWLGVLNAAAFAPTLFSFVFGHWIDNKSQRKILVYLEVGQSIATLTITLLLVMKIDQPFLICLFVFFTSLFGMNTYIVQDAFIPKLVNKNELEEAQMYMSLGYKTSDLLFNAISGFLISILNISIIMLTSFFSFIFSAFLFKKIDVLEEDHHFANDSNSKNNIFEGFRIILSSRILLVLTMGATISNILFSGFNIYIIMIAKNLESPILLGLMNAGLAIGSILGSTIVTRVLLSEKSLYQKLAIGTILYGFVLFISFIFTESYSIIILLTISGIPLGITHTVINPIIQSHVPERDLGKVFSSKYTIEVGVMPLASLLFGGIAKILPTNIFFIIFGLTYIFIGILYTYFIREDQSIKL